MHRSVTATDGFVEALLRRDRLMVGGALAGLTALGWAYLYWDAVNMHCARMAAPEPHAWSPAQTGITFAMWSIMMVAMMIPSAAPMLLTFAAVNRRRLERSSPYVPTFVFLLGYLAVWTAFSGVATAAQWLLQRTSLLAATLESASPVFAGTLLIVAGAFQLTSWKDRCLSLCHSPFSFIMTSWRDGVGGALEMGIKHGAYCTGCCWAVMALLFVAGVMNLWWIAVLSLFVLLEKLVPWFRRPAGPVMIAAGVWLILAA